MSTSGVASGPATPSGRYYCHKCLTEVSATSDLTCSTCASGFIEALTTDHVEGQDVSGRSDSQESASGRARTSRISFESLLDGPYSRPRRRRTGDRVTVEIGYSGNPRNSATARIRVPRPSHNRDEPSNSGSSTSPPIMESLGQVITDFVQNIQHNGAALGNPPLVVFGNPGDYAWGREGVDSIVTQMLNQMDSSGPPPLSRDMIRDIPSVGITAQHVEDNLTCSVCWDIFIIAESVKKLPCDHMYHIHCIEPWLALHATCPICRQQLGNGQGTVEADRESRLDAIFRVTDRLREEDFRTVSRADHFRILNSSIPGFSYVPVPQRVISSTSSSSSSSSSSTSSLEASAGSSSTPSLPGSSMSPAASVESVSSFSSMSSFGQLSDPSTSSSISGYRGSGATSDCSLSTPSTISSIPSNGGSGFESVVSSISSILSSASQALADGAVSSLDGESLHSNYDVTDMEMEEFLNLPLPEDHHEMN